MYKYKASKKKAREYAAKLDEISAFCAENGIEHSASMDSYYFSVHGQRYRVSNHTIEASNAHADGQCRDKYHPDTREPEVVYIHASKTRLKEIYRALQAGKVLDGRGYVK